MKVDDGLHLLSDQPRSFARSITDGVSAVVAGAAMWFGRRRAHVALVALLTRLWGLYSPVGAPLSNTGSSSQGLIQGPGAEIGPDAQLGLVGWREQQLLMADRGAATFGFNRDGAGQFKDALPWQRRKPAVRWLVVEGSALQACVEKLPARDAGNANRGQWWLLSARSTRTCTR